MQFQKSISVVIPNYNGKKLLELYLPSVYAALKFNIITYEIIIIDDASKDDSVLFLEHYYPEIKIIKNNQNLGFSKTINKGIFAAKNELILLLNSDVKLEEEYFEHQYKYFQNQNTFGVMGRIMNFDGKKIEDAARLLVHKGYKFKANKFYYSTDKNSDIYTTYLSGANALVDRVKIQAIGGFDEIYSPFYFEDFDLGLRAYKMGWVCHYEHQSVCYHKVSATTNTMKKSNRVKIIYHRNSYILQAIHLKGLQKKMYLIQIIFNSVLLNLLRGDFWILKSYISFLKMNLQIKKSIFNLNILKEKYNSTIEIADIKNLIANSIQNKNIKWL